MTEEKKDVDEQQGSEKVGDGTGFRRQHGYSLLSSILRSSARLASNGATENGRSVCGCDRHPTVRVPFARASRAEGSGLRQIFVPQCCSRPPVGLLLENNIDRVDDSGYVPEDGKQNV